MARGLVIIPFDFFPFFFLFFPFIFDVGASVSRFLTARFLVFFTSELFLIGSSSYLGEKAILAGPVETWYAYTYKDLLHFNEKVVSISS